MAARLLLSLKAMSCNLLTHIALLLLIAAVGCSANSAADSTAGPTPTVVGDLDGGGATSTPDTAKEGSSDIVGPNRILMIHAAANVGNVRICFEGLNTFPFPRARYIANSNQRGVESGGASYLDLTAEEKATLGATSGSVLKVSLYENTSLAQARREVLTCNELANPAQNFAVGRDVSYVTVPKDVVLNPGPQVLALVGCSSLGNIANIAGRLPCDTSIKTANANIERGTLEFRIIKPQLARIASVDADGGKSRPALQVFGVNLMLEQPAVTAKLASPSVPDVEVPLDEANTPALLERRGSFDAADYENKAFALKLQNGDTVRASMLQTQQRFAPNVLPSEYYGSGVPHLVAVVGEPNVVRIKGHILSIPLIDRDEPKTESDAGAPDSGTSTDGGTR